MPKDLFDSFRVNTIEEGWAVADETFASFREQKIKSQFLQPAIEFIENVPKTTQERVDEIRQWGPQVLSFMKGKNANIASSFLLNFFRKESAVNLKKNYRWTRFRALSSLDNLVECSRDESLKKQFADILNIIAYDEDEYYANQALSSLLIAKLNFDNSETTKAIAKIRHMLIKEAPENHNMNFEAKLKMDAEPTLCALNALNEVCLPNESEIRKDIVTIMKYSPYYNHRTEAIRALRKYKQDRTVVFELGHFIRTNSDHHLRQLAVASIGELQNPQAKDFLLESLTDRDTDVRAEAIKAFPKLFDKPFSALRTIAEEAIKEDTNPVKFGFFVEALRKIDQDKNLCVQVLASDLDSDDHNRATRAQQILAEVGGLASIQKLSRRRTLEASYKVLEDSEKALTLIFSSNTLQATRGFYFAMGVNITIVSVGIVLVGLAIVQVIQNPENFFGWITPGAGGVFGIILTLYFNGPRKNAQQDLAILMNANMIYLGFLRMINEIDATFKHEFMEKSDFNADTTAKAVKQIAETIKTTLDYTSNFLFKPGETDGIVIKGLGADGKEHTVTYVITVKPGPTPTPKIRITSPTTGSIVPEYSNVVVGTSDRLLSSDQHLWIVVDIGGQWWPQNNEATVAYSSQTQTYGFSVPEVRVGVDSDVNRTFLIRTILVDPAINQKFLNWFQTGLTTGNYPGMLQTDVNSWGTVVLSDFVTVTRK